MSHFADQDWVEFTRDRAPAERQGAMDAVEAKKGLHELPVVLRCGEQNKARTKTNQFGEFQLEFDPAEELHLSFELSREMEVIIPLSGFRTGDGEVTWI